VFNSTYDMSREERQAEFLARAREAEEQAARASDPTARSAWLRIAASYRHLAETT
jgi:hypothetical protein